MGDDGSHRRTSTTALSSSKFEDDVWTKSPKHFDRTSVAMVDVIMEECVWKFAFVRDLQAPNSRLINAKRIKRYAASQGKMQSQDAGHVELCLSEGCQIGSWDHQLFGTHNIKRHINCASGGILEVTLIMDKSTSGTMQIPDARHMEMFLSEGFQNGSWDYQLEGAHNINRHTDGVADGIFEIKHIMDNLTSDIFNLKAWIGKPKEDWQPKAMITLHAVAVNTNLQDTEEIFKMTPKAKIRLPAVAMNADMQKSEDWMRIGGFLFDAPVAFLVEKLALPWRIPRGISVEEILNSSGLNNIIKTGILMAATVEVPGNISLSQGGRMSKRGCRSQVKNENTLVQKKKLKKRKMEESLWVMHLMISDPTDMEEEINVADLIHIEGAAMEAVEDDPTRSRVFETRQWAEVSQMRSLSIIGGDQHGWVLHVHRQQGYIFFNVLSGLQVPLIPYDDNISTVVYGTWTGTPGEPDCVIYLVNHSSEDNCFIRVHRHTGDEWLTANLEFHVVPPPPFNWDEFLAVHDWGNDLEGAAIDADADADEGEDAQEQDENEAHPLLALSCHGGTLHMLCGTRYACFLPNTLMRMCEIDLRDEFVGIVHRHFSFVHDDDQVYLVMMASEGTYTALRIDYVAHEYHRLPNHSFGPDRVVYTTNIIGGMAMDARYPEEGGYMFALGGGFGPNRDGECIRVSPVQPPQMLKICTAPDEVDHACYCSCCFLGHRNI